MNLPKATVIFCLLLLFICLSSPSRSQDSAKLFINTEPEDVAIRILNYPETFEQGMPLQPGTYIIRVSKPGYDPETKKVTLTNTDDFTLDVKLNANGLQASKPSQPAPSALQEKEIPPADAGRLFVQADPPDVTIRILRIKPVFKQGIALEPGTYTIEVSKEGYTTKTSQVEIKKGQDTKEEIALFLKADMGKLYVNTDPMDANVRLPDISPSYEPGMELPHGDYTVEISKDGFKPVTEKITIAEGKIKRLNVALEPLSEEEKTSLASKDDDQEPSSTPTKGTMTIQVSPPDAAVIILDIDTPYAAGMELDSGFYVVEAQKEGYVTATSKVAVKPDENTTIALSLTPESVQAPDSEEQSADAPRKAFSETFETGNERLFVKTIPADAGVRILNITPKFTQGMKLEPGVYEVEVKKQDAGKAIHNTRIAAGKDTHVRIDLTADNEERKTKPEPKEADAHQRTQSSASAPTPAQQAVQKPPLNNDSISLRKKAVEAIKRNDYEQALQLVRQALALAEPDLASYHLLGQVYSLMEEYQKALEAYNLASALAPNNATTYALRGKAYIRLDDVKSACYDFWKACSLGKCKEISLAKKSGICN